MRMQITERGTGNDRSGKPFGVPCSVFRVLVIALLAFAPVAAFACPVCYGPSDDPMVKSANSGVWVLLGIVAFVQVGFAAMFWSFWRRAKAQQRFKESLRVIEGGLH